jgi:hypothetical protein
VRLIVEIQAVGNQFFELDLRWTFKRTPAAGPSTFATVATVGTISTMLAGPSTTTARSIAPSTGTSFSTLFLRRPRRTILSRRPRVRLGLGLSFRLNIWLRFGLRFLLGSGSFRSSGSRFRRRRYSFGLCFVVSYIIHAMSLMTAYSADNLAHSSATRPAGRNFTVTALRPIRSAISVVRAF